MWMVFAAFLFGILVGGVANLLGADLPGRGARTGPHCPYCGQGRPWWQWLGLTAYLVGRAQCPSCGASIGIHGPLIEIGLGLAYGYMKLPDGRWPLERVPGKMWASIGEIGRPNKWITLRALALNR
jgi:prepilin signal peptidase PulO-like enzyme (type II secretory pathway)